MRYISTRGSSVSFSEAVAQGLAPDGGLYLPEEVSGFKFTCRVLGQIRLSVFMH